MTSPKDFLDPMTQDETERDMVRRYFHGWFMWLRAFRMARAKKHGAGRMRLRYALRMAGCYRWIVDGQMRVGKFPRWMRQRQ